MKTILTLAALAMAGAAHAQGPVSWITPTEPFRIADNLYYVGTAGISAFPVTVDGVRRDATVYCSTSVAANRLVPRSRGPQYPSIVADYRNSFAQLKALKADVFLAPHGEQFGLAAKRARLAAGGPNPFVDPTELPRMVAKSEADFERDLARQQEVAK